jgi:hypothetical protein
MKTTRLAITMACLMLLTILNSLAVHAFDCPQNNLCTSDIEISSEIGTISGKVFRLGSLGNDPIEGATITCERTDVDENNEYYYYHQETSDENGNFYFGMNEGLPVPGFPFIRYTYRVTCEKEGYETQTRTVYLTLGDYHGYLEFRFYTKSEGLFQYSLESLALE